MLSLKNDVFFAERSIQNYCYIQRQLQKKSNRLFIRGQEAYQTNGNDAPIRGYFHTYRAILRFEFDFCVLKSVTDKIKW